MASRLNWKKIVLIVWASTLAFGLSHQIAVADSLHASCQASCGRACGKGNCSGASQIGCTCYYLCQDGTEGAIYCVV